MNYERTELLDRLAGAYALGTLRGPALRRFRKLMLQSPQIRQATLRWESQLAELAQVVPPQTPPAKTWAHIETRLGWVRKPVPSSRWSWLKPATVLSVGLMVGIGVVRMQPETFVSLDTLAEREQALPQSYIGLLLDGQNRATVLASSTRHGTHMTIKLLRPIEVPVGKVLQLWAFPQDKTGKALTPFPVGVVPASGKGGSLEMTASAERLLSNVSRLSVTVQDHPAQANDLPPESADAFVLTGHCVKLW